MIIDVKYNGLSRTALWRGWVVEVSRSRIASRTRRFQVPAAWIKETVLGAGHEVIFLPKFHPEFNWIERYWGAAKKYTRRNCNYTWDGLVEAVPKVLESVSVEKMRHFARKSLDTWMHIMSWRVVCI